MADLENQFPSQQSAPASSPSSVPRSPVALVAPYTEVRGHGLRLRPWDVESGADVDAWLRGVSDPDFLRWNTPLKRVEDAEDAREALRLRAEWDAEGRSVSFCVTDEASGRPLGHIGVNDIDGFMRTARVGYWVLPEARGRGVAGRALRLATRHAFAELGVHRVELGHALGHEASCRIAERGGYRYEGTLRGAMFESGRQDAFRDVHLHGRLATDPEPVTATAAP